MTLSSVVVIMVSSVFLVQNQFYAIQLERAGVQDNARMVTELVASEIRSLVDDGVVTAENKKLVVRSPMVLGAVCAHGTGNRVMVQVEGGVSGITTSEVGGVALRDSVTGAWAYRDAAWNSIYQSGGSPAASCAGNGADTTGASSHFMQMRGLNGLFGGTPPVGSVLLLYRRVEYSFAASTMDPTTTALYRKIGTGTAVEFATGMDASAQFRYRTGGSTYDQQVSSGSVGAIDAIRIEAQARRRPRTGGTDDVTFGWGVNVILRNGG